MNEAHQISWLARFTASFTRLLPIVSACGRCANSKLLSKWLGEGGPIWVRLRWGSWVQCFRGDYIGRALFYFGDLDPKISWVCRRVLEKGDTFIDVGANIGLLTTLASKIVGETGKVVSVEPQPKALACLEAALERNQCRNVSVVRCGVGNKEEELLLRIPSGNIGGASFVSIPDREAETVNVEVKTLATVQEELSCPVAKLVKLDVEGFEGEVVEGVMEVWEKAPPEVIIFELRGDEPVTETKVGTLLKKLGYSFYRLPSVLLAPRLEPLENCEGNFSHDIVAIHQTASYNTKNLARQVSNY